MQYAIGVVILIVLGGGVWFAFLMNDGGEPASEEVTNQPTAAEDEATEAENLSGLGTLASLFALGQNVRCTFASDGPDGSSSGTFYTDSERMRVSASHTYSGEEAVTDMIHDGEFMYVWGESPEGPMAITLVTPDPITVDESNAPSGPSGEYVDMDERVSYDCERWSVDTSVFVPPSDVEFMDMAAMMQEMFEGMPEAFTLPEGVELPPGVTMP